MSQMYVPEKEDERHEETYPDVVKEEISSSSTPREIDLRLSAEEELDARRRARRNKSWYISWGGVILVLLILLGAMLGLVKGQGKRWESVIEELSSRVRVRCRGGGGGGPRGPKGPDSSFSTKYGTVATYVYTTKPIVNPGGYTIGTLTAYVTYTGKPLSTTASAAPAATSSTAPTSISTLTSTRTTDLTHEESTSSTEAEGHSHPSNTNRASPTHKEHHSAPTPTDPPTIPDSLLQPLVNGPKRLKRLLDQDAQEHVLEEGTSSVAPNTLTTVPDQDGRECSYSVRKDGGTATFVKTTRPIVNPAGYTIGTLDGVFVELKITRPRSTGTAKRGGVKNPKVHQPVVRSREELRKRARVDFGVGMQL